LNNEKISSLDEELAVVKFALEQQKSNMSSVDLAKLLEHSKEAEVIKRRAGESSSMRDEVTRLSKELEETKVVFKNKQT